MSYFTDTVVLDVLHGHCNDVFAEAIIIAKALDKNVQFKFNGVDIVLNKNSTMQCFIKQYKNDVSAH